MSDDAQKDLTEQGADPAAGSKATDEATHAMPTPFQMLCASLAAQIQMALGLIPDPIENKVRVELEAARHGIDMLSSLEEKTKGNLDDEEEKTLTVLLTHLRMLYVERAKEQKAAAEQPAAEKPAAEKPEAGASE